MKRFGVLLMTLSSVTPASSVFLIALTYSLSGMVCIIWPSHEHHPGVSSHSHAANPQWEMRRQRVSHLISRPYEGVQQSCRMKNPQPPLSYKKLTHRLTVTHIPVT